MMSDFGAVVVDATVAEAAGIAGHSGVLLLPGRRRRGSQVDAMADVVASAPASAVVMARPPWADPAAAPLAGIAMLLGRDLVWLPSGLAQAGWAAALIARWAEDTHGTDLLRRAQVAVGLAALPPCRLPRRPWGCAALPMPALMAESLARWCDRLWAPCTRCADGGSAPGTPCGRCGHQEPGT